MHYTRLLFITLLSFGFISSPLSALAAQDPVKGEKLYQSFYSLFLHQQSGAVQFQLVDASSFSQPELSTILDAFEDVLAETATPIDPDSFLTEQQAAQMPAREQLRWFRIRSTLNPNISGSAEELRVVSRVESFLLQSKIDLGLIYEILSSKSYLYSDSGKQLVSVARRLAPTESDTFDNLTGQTFDPPDPAEIFNLFAQYPRIAEFRAGNYDRHPRLFVFCRKKRDYPCLMVMKDKNDQPVRLPDGMLWSQRALAKSRRGLSFNQPNGNTPAGVHLVNGVMPDADQQLSFGKFRRLILNFVPRDEPDNEEFSKLFLPPSSHNSTWWRQATIARDIGRDLLRIHGTGRINQDPSSVFYPHMPTAGCISQREGTYGNTNFIDQRQLLNEWLRASDLAQEYSNETLLRGVLYLIEIDDKEKPMSLDDLVLFGIQ
jgi:hypothetical protein